MNRFNNPAFDPEHEGRGLTVLEYFMAQASPYPPDWFEPNVPNRKLPPVKENYVRMTDQKNDPNKFNFGDPEWKKLDAEYDKMYKIEKIMQWPRYWAEEQIKRANT